MDDKMKEMFDKVKETTMSMAEIAGQMANSAAKKAGQFVDVAKLNLQVFNLNTDIDILYKDIGKNVYLTHTGVEVDEQYIEKKLEEIDGKNEKIEELKSIIAEHKAEVTCPECGKPYCEEDAYCSSCGAKL